jgi:hypothetical protein
MTVILGYDTITISDASSNKVVETVKTHVPEVDINIDIVPAITNSEGDPAFELLTYTHSGGSEDQTEYNLTINEDTTCDILIVGGGGSGGQFGGGGGGGDVLYYQNVTLNGTYNINVGKGGYGNNRDSSTHGGGSNGNNSSIIGGDINVIAGGGGGGGGYSALALAGTSVSYTNPITGQSSTSSGGGGGNIKSGTDSVNASGNTVSGDGADNLGSVGGGGGGGGSGGVLDGSIGDAPDKPAVDVGGDGGIGLSSDISGVLTEYGGGGGGGDWTREPYIIGVGVYGGGNGSIAYQNPGNGLSGTGGGGGGAGSSASATYGQGGSGIVIIRKYLTPSALYEAQTTVTQYPVLPADSTNLVAHYKFDDDANDSSGNDKHLTEYNITYENTDKIIGQSSFHNGSGYFEISNDGYFSPDIFSVSCWVKAYQQFPHQAIASCRGSGYTGWIIYILDNQITIFTGSGSNWIQTTTYPNFASNPPVWRHLVVVWNKSTSSLQIYVNGNLESTVSITGYTNNNITNLRIGAGKNETTADLELSNNSLIDDFRIYDKALSAYEIDILANNKIENPNYKLLTFTYDETLKDYPVIDSDAANLVAWYKFDDAQNLGKDELNQRNLVNTNAESLSGVIGDSSYFDDGDYLHISNFNFNLDNTITTSGLSISLWFKLDSTSDYYGHLFMWGNHGNTEKFALMRYNLERKLVFQLGTTMQTAFDISAYNTWINLIITIDTSRLLKVYENTVLIHQFTLTQSQYSGLTTSSPFTLGRAYNISSHDLKGNLDDFRIYDKTLSATEISDLYNQYSQTSYTVNFPEETTCDILIVGGGGGGGAVDAGGGGAGGLIYSTGIELNGTYTIKVGNGGTGGIGVSPVSGQPGNKGYNSQILSSDETLNYEAIGGGGGGQGHPTDTEPSPAGGGSSGGLGSSDISRDALNVHIPGQGNSGGTGAGTYGGGGGGGAGAPGGNANGSYAGLGGDGREIDITGTNTYYAGGGGGGFSRVNGVWINRNGGLGGGGIGIGQGAGLNVIQNGENGKGGGGGGGGSGWGSGGNGGSGIVIIRYNTKYIRQHPAYDAQWTYSSTDTSVYHYGNVGIGTLASDTTALTVKGDLNISGYLFKNNKVLYDNPWHEKDNKDIFNNNVNVGIGFSDPQYKLHVNGVVFANNGGITENGSNSWSTPSDLRIKINVVEASNELCFENIKNINLYKFNYLGQFSNRKNKTQYGFIAQEVQNYYPKAVQEKVIQVKDNVTIDNLLTVDVTQINYTLYGAVKHFVNEVDKIKSQLGIVDIVEEEPVTEDTEEPVTEDTEEPVTNIDLD